MKHPVVLSVLDRSIGNLNPNPVSLYLNTECRHGPPLSVQEFNVPVNIYQYTVFTRI